MMGDRRSGNHQQGGGGRGKRGGRGGGREGSSRGGGRGRQQHSNNNKSRTWRPNAEFISSMPTEGPVRNFLEDTGFVRPDYVRGRCTPLQVKPAAYIVSSAGSRGHWSGCPCCCCSDEASSKEPLLWTLP